MLLFRIIVCVMYYSYSSTIFILFPFPTILFSILFPSPTILFSILFPNYFDRSTRTSANDKDPRSSKKVRTSFSLVITTYNFAWKYITAWDGHSPIMIPVVFVLFAYVLLCFVMLSFVIFCYILSFLFYRELEANRKEMRNLGDVILYLLYRTLFILCRINNIHIRI